MHLQKERNEMKRTIRPAKISSVGSYLPERILTNTDLEKMVDTSDEWIRLRTGISERRIISPQDTTSDLAARAAKAALKKVGVKPEEVDMIIVATVTPDMLFPATACLVQEKIGARNCAAFDIEVGCTGFVYGVSIASQFVQTGACDNVLVIGAEALSRLVDWQDRNTCILFGDGAGAVLIQPSEDEGPEILYNLLKADGKGGGLLHIPAGGSKLPASDETVKKRLHAIQMNGNEVFKFAVKTVGEVVIEALENCGLKKEDVDFLVPHQANIRIIEAFRKRLELPEEKVIITVNKYGNMSSATIPVSLEEAVEKGKINKDDIVVAVGFGAGLTWGVNIIRW